MSPLGKGLQGGRVLPGKNLPYIPSFTSKGRADRTGFFDAAPRLLQNNVVDQAGLAQLNGHGNHDAPLNYV